MMTAEEPQATEAMKQTLQREAQAWVVRLGSQQATEDHAQAFRRWCARSREHAQAFVQARQVWQAMAPAAQRVRQQEAREAARRLPVPGRRAFLGGAVAASVAYLAVSPPLALWPSVAEWGDDYRTATGEQREVAMGDGVVLQMNTQTRINLRRGATESAGEAIELVSGEAEVLAGGPASARVTVAAGGGTVSATRARFNIRHLDGEVCVTCLAGQVDVAQGTQQARLDEGRQYRFQLAGVFGLCPGQLFQSLGAHDVHAPAEDLVDQVFLAAEVIVDRGDVDIGPAGHLAQRGAAEAVQCEQFLGGAKDPVFGRELLCHHPVGSC